METAVVENRISDRGSSYPGIRSWPGSGSIPVHHRRRLERPEAEFVGMSHYSGKLDPNEVASEWTLGKWLPSILNTPSVVIDTFEGFEKAISRRVFISHISDDEGLGLAFGSADIDAFGRGVIDDHEDTLSNLLYQAAMRWLEEFYSSRSLQPNLEAALNDLTELESEARDAGYLIPSSIAINSARYLVNEMHRIRPLRYHIYPMPDGEVAIDGGEQGTRIGVFCYPDGEIQYIGWVNGECVEEHSTEVRRIPSGFLLRALSELEGD